MLFLLIKYTWPISYLLIANCTLIFPTCKIIISTFDEIVHRARVRDIRWKFSRDALFQFRFDGAGRLPGKYASIYVQITARCSWLSNRAHAENGSAAETLFRKLQCIRSAKFPAPALCARFAGK